MARRSESKIAVQIAPEQPISAGRKLKIALAGFGTVGRSVAKLLSENPHSPFVLTHIYNRNIARKKVDWIPAQVRWTEKIEDVLASDADIFVEVVGGLEPAGEWVSKALRAGKSVVTANKLLIAERGPELLRLARQTSRHGQK